MDLPVVAWMFSGCIIDLRIRIVGLCPGPEPTLRLVRISRLAVR